MATELEQRVDQLEQLLGELALADAISPAPGDTIAPTGVVTPIAGGGAGFEVVELTAAAEHQFTGLDADADGVWEFAVDGRLDHLGFERRVTLYPGSDNQVCPTAGHGMREPPNEEAAIPSFNSNGVVLGGLQGDSSTCLLSARARFVCRRHANLSADPGVAPRVCHFTTAIVTATGRRFVEGYSRFPSIVQADNWTSALVRFDTTIAGTGGAFTGLLGLKRGP